MKRKTERNLRRQKIEEQIRELTQEVKDDELWLSTEDDPQRREEIESSTDGVRDEISRLNSLLLGDGLKKRCRDLLDEIAIAYGDSARGKVRSKLLQLVSNVRGRQGPPQQVSV